MVVDNVQFRGQPALVARIHEFFQAGRSAVTVLNRKREDTVVAPITRAGKLGDRHDFDGSDSSLHQFVQMGNYRFESSLGRERSHVQLIDDVVLDGKSEPMPVLPVESRVDNFRRAVDSFGLITRDGIGQFLTGGETILVTCTGLDSVYDRLMVPGGFLLHADRAILRTQNVELNIF